MMTVGISLGVIALFGVCFAYSVWVVSRETTVLARRRDADKLHNVKPRPPSRLALLWRRLHPVAGGRKR